MAGNKGAAEPHPRSLCPPALPQYIFHICQTPTPQFFNDAVTGKRQRFKGEKTEDLTGYHCNRPLTNLKAQTLGNLHFPTDAH